MTRAGAQLRGHGLVAIPRAPYRLDRVPGARETTLRLTTAEGASTIDLHAIARGEAEPHPELEIAPAAARGAFRVETAAYSIPWPEGFAVASDPDGLSPFLLVGEGDVLLWTTGPIARQKAQPVEKLAAAHQTIRAVAERGDDARIDVDYHLDGEPWWQRRHAIAWPDDEAIVVSAQARLADEARASAAVDAVADDVRPRRLD